VTQLTGWGRYPRHESELVAASTPAMVPQLLARGTGIIARGNGRAYGDAAIGERMTLATGGLDRLRAFDPSTGRLTVEAGVLLSDILTALVPRGFFPPVVPGTKLVTVGGMTAADVHGKNHHRDGGFGAHVEELTLAVPGGQTMTCSRTDNAEVFAATIGGMGLTGTIVEATFRLKHVETGWMRQRTLVASDLDDAMAALHDTADATYSVAWIDCLARGPSLGRSLIYAAEHATRDDVAALRPGAELFPTRRPGGLAVPLDFPSGTLNRTTVKAFNELYFRRGARTAGQPFLVHWDPYFFPLDGIGAWNRIYGRNGFLQYQCVIPSAAARDVLGEIIERIAQRGNASFLAVLKQLGHNSIGTMSFPMEGFTLALDLPVTSDVFPLLDELDRLVSEAGGRLYLAKDARQSPATFEAGYPALPAFRNVRRALGAEGHMASRLSSRLGI
jgi:decaprenylphospho-beta-D-ribofuranose 2-oxidase